MQYIVDSILTILFWVSPIVYCIHVKDLQSWGDGFFYAYHLNPLAGILDAYRSILWYGQAPHLDTLAISAVITLLIGILGVAIFWRHEREFADMM